MAGAGAQLPPRNATKRYRMPVGLGESSDALFHPQIKRKLTCVGLFLPLEFIWWVEREFFQWFSLGKRWSSL